MTTVFKKHKTVTARKNKICGFCSKRILKGEQYRYFRKLKEGSKFTGWDMHINCEEKFLAEKNRIERLDFFHGINQ